MTDSISLAFVKHISYNLRMSRKKLARPKKQRHLQLAYMHLLEELKPALAPSGLDLSDGQAVDVAVATLHELLVEKRGAIVDTDKLMALLNRQFRKQFVESMVKVLAELGHTDIHTELRKDFSISVECDAGSFTVPPQMFARADAESGLREMQTGLSI